LNKDPFYGVGIIARPKFGEIFQSFVIGTSATAGAEHHRQIGVFLLDTFQYFIQTVNVVDIKMGLLVFQISRINIGDGAIAIPFEVSDSGIFGFQPVYHVEDIILYFGVTQVEYQLIPEVILVAVRETDDPVFVFFI